MARQRLRTMSSDQQIDLFSGLPEPIIHHIMSFLSTKEVARISMVSKQFQHLWSSFPIIDFDQELFSKIKRRFSSEVILDSDNVLEYVKNSIRLRRLDTVLKMFRLKLDLKGVVDIGSRVDEIIRFALENNVQDLDVEIKLKKDGSSSDRYALMEGFSSRSLTKLKLNGLQFDINCLISSCPLVKSLILTDCLVSENQSINNASYKSLTTLSFNGLDLTDNWIEEHVSLFSNLKILVLSRCNRLKNIRVNNKNLEKLEVTDCSILKSIELAVPKLRSLHLGINYFVDEKWLKEKVSSLSLLENLSLHRCTKLRKIEIISDGLRSLELIGFRDIVEVSIDATNLVSFVYSGNLSAFRLMNSRRLRNPKLSYLKDEIFRNVEIQAWKLLRHSLSLFSHCEALTLECHSSKDLIFPEDVRDCTLPLLCDVKHLKIINRSWEIIDQELIDNFLWISPHLETLCLVPASGMEKIVKIHYGKIIEREESCCRGLPLRCWRDDMENVELQNFEDVYGKEQLMAYFGQSAKKFRYS